MTREWRSQRPRWCQDQLSYQRSSESHLLHLRISSSMAPQEPPSLAKNTTSGIYHRFNRPVGGSCTCNIPSPPTYFVYWGQGGPSEQSKVVRGILQYRGQTSYMDLEMDRESFWYCRFWGGSPKPKAIGLERTIISAILKNPLLHVGKEGCLD
jgi:hypothetical protein